MGKTWQRNPVCRRFNSNAQVVMHGKLFSGWRGLLEVSHPARSPESLWVEPGLYQKNETKTPMWCMKTYFTLSMNRCLKHVLDLLLCQWLRKASCNQELYEEATKILRQLPRINLQAYMSVPALLLTGCTGYTALIFSGKAVPSTLKPFKTTILRNCIGWRESNTILVEETRANYDRGSI